MFPWLVPTERCVNNCDDATVAVALAMSLPEVNRLVLSYLIRFLQVRMCRASLDSLFSLVNLRWFANRYAQ